MKSKKARGVYIDQKFLRKCWDNRASLKKLSGTLEKSLNLKKTRLDLQKKNLMNLFRSVLTPRFLNKSKNLILLFKLYSKKKKFKKS